MRAELEGQAVSSGAASLLPQAGLVSRRRLPHERQRLILEADPSARNGRACRPLVVRPEARVDLEKRVASSTQPAGESFTWHQVMFSRLLSSERQERSICWDAPWSSATMRARANEARVASRTRTQMISIRVKPERLDTKRQRMRVRNPFVYATASSSSMATGPLWAEHT